MLVRVLTRSVYDKTDAIPLHCLLLRGPVETCVGEHANLWLSCEISLQVSAERKYKFVFNPGKYSRNVTFVWDLPSFVLVEIFLVDLSWWCCRRRWKQLLVWPQTPMMWRLKSDHRWRLCERTCTRDFATRYAFNRWFASPLVKVPNFCSSFIHLSLKSRRTQSLFHNKICHCAGSRSWGTCIHQDAWRFWSSDARRSGKYAASYVPSCWILSNLVYYTTKFILSIPPISSLSQLRKRVQSLMDPSLQILTSQVMCSQQCLPILSWKGSFGLNLDRYMRCLTRMWCLSWPQTSWSEKHQNCDTDPCSDILKTLIGVHMTGNAHYIAVLSTLYIWESNLHRWCWVFLSGMDIMVCNARVLCMLFTFYQCDCWSI